MARIDPIDRAQLANDVALLVLPNNETDESNRIFNLGYNNALWNVRNLITSAQPVHAVPVVRCKDCALRGEDECPMMFYEASMVSDDWLKWTEYVPHDRTTSDGFCHMGRRADDETD